MNILQIHFASACGREIFQRRTFAKRLAFHEYLLLRVKLWVRIILGHPVWSNLNWNSFIYPWRIYKSIMLHLVEGKFSSKELLLRGWHIIHIYCWWSNYELVLFFWHPVWSNLNWNSSIYPWRIYGSILLHLVEGKIFSNQLLLRGWHIMNIYCWESNYESQCQLMWANIALPELGTAQPHFFFFGSQPLNSFKP